MGGRVVRTAEDRLKAEALERFRQSGIRLDREGRFWHEGAEVAHAGLRRAFLRWMDRLDDGRPVLRLDEDRYVYLEVDDAPLLVTAARWQGDRAFITTNDGVEQELACESLRTGDDNAMYCSVRDGRLEARITTPAFYVLAEHIEESADGFGLRARGRLFDIGSR
jgi:hypothetical protein